MVKKFSLLSILSILGHVLTSQAACSRQVLQTTKDAFLAKGGVSNVKLAASARIAQNNKIVKSIKETVYGSNPTRATPFELFVFEEATCNVAFFTVLNAPTPQLTSTRAQVGQNGEVTELEIVKSAGKGAGKGGVPNTVQNATALWSAPVGSVTSRDQMIKILDSYPSGVQARSGKNVQTTPNCARMENGMKMPFKCNQSFEALGFPVTNRAYYVDTKTGISLAKFYFDWSVMPLWLHEYMKITNGKVTEIQAVYITGSKGFKDVLANKRLSM